MNTKKMPAFFPGHAGAMKVRNLKSRYPKAAATAGSHLVSIAAPVPAQVARVPAGVPRCPYDAGSYRQL